MAEHVVVEAETVKDWAVQPTDDGRRKAVVFKLEAGSAGYSFPPDDFDRFAQSVIAEAGRGAGDKVADATPPPVNADPASVNAISIDIHPADSSCALLALQVGEVRQLFAVDATTLLQSCKEYLERRRSSRAGS